VDDALSPERPDRERETAPEVDRPPPPYSRMAREPEEELPLRERSRVVTPLFPSYRRTVEEEPVPPTPRVDDRALSRDPLEE
jgi:hypothetical protein